MHRHRAASPRHDYRSAWVATGWVCARKRRGHYPGLTTSISINTSIILLLLLFSFNTCFPLFGTSFSLLMMNGGLPLPVLTCLPTYLLCSSRMVGPDRADLLFPHTRTHLPAYMYDGRTRRITAVELANQIVGRSRQTRNRQADKTDRRRHASLRERSNTTKEYPHDVFFFFGFSKMRRVLRSLIHTFNYSFRCYTIYTARLRIPTTV